MAQGRWRYYLMFRDEFDGADIDWTKWKNHMGLDPPATPKDPRLTTTNGKGYARLTPMMIGGKCVGGTLDTQVVYGGLANGAMMFFLASPDITAALYDGRR
jgi:hypothetical protein